MPAALAQTRHIKVQPRVYNEIAHDLSAPLRSFAGRKRVSVYKADENGVVPKPDDFRLNTSLGIDL